MVLGQLKSVPLTHALDDVIYNGIINEEFSDKGLALMMNKSEHTIHNNWERICHALEVKNRAAAGDARNWDNGVAVKKFEERFAARYVYITMQVVREIHQKFFLHQSDGPAAHT